MAAQSRRSASEASGSDDEYDGFGLDDLMPQPESPLPAPFNFATYEPPEGFSLDLPEGRNHVILRTVGHHALWAHHVWNTSRILSDWLMENSQIYRGRRVLELGAGAGLPSIVIAAGGGSSTVITDYPDRPLLENLEYNVECNLPGREDVEVEGYVWGAKSAHLLSSGKGKGKERAREDGGEKFSLMLLSDVVFNHSQHRALIATANTLLADRIPGVPATDIARTPSLLISITHHRPHLAEADMAFFPALVSSGNGWAYEKVFERFAGEMFKNDPGDAVVRGTVRGWRAWRVAEGEQPGEVGA